MFHRKPTIKEIPPESITVAIFCTLAFEAVAVRYIFDEELTCHPTSPGPKNYIYTFGRIANHNILLARPHHIGPVQSAHCAATVRHHFPNLQFALSIGTAGGIPRPHKRDIRLGDIAIGLPGDNHPGVLEHDFGKYEQDRFVLKGCANKPPGILISADGSLEEDEIMDRSPVNTILESITSAQPKYARPADEDILYDSDFHHLNPGDDCSACEASTKKKHVARPVRPHTQPLVHRGLILSGNEVVKNPRDRDQLRRGYDDALCFEMEAAGIVDEIPCLVVRGICNYADTHKQDTWRYYAAAAAAAYGRAVLGKIDGVDGGWIGSWFRGVRGLFGGLW
ncbi:5'-methylthioadenosine/S-adenosylhomocysteine nucleosidase family protein [Aspergillus ibericus CBS 121593]|uniref:Purine and uridine phosphorylase n=1 Tax=Aspergillus ibericus CBS 121593 TaxID=1448316 RepID=A0A395H3M2_9EURO|nr:purine and uridine phosphorylase [Aspergillus ibericus CBS 121593]RAL02501.1 purine and uridine phosphorylase [Aspergillus ibericus CBS 121593]